MRNDHRRTFILLSAALLAAPHAAIAQPAQKLRRIGFLSLDTSDSPAGQGVLKAFPAALNKLGYKVGENLVIEWRWAEGKIERLPGLAEDLVRGKVEIIVARTNDPIVAAMRATKTIPIVMFNGNLPVESKLVASLARPGGNVTGTSYIVPSMFAKQMEILKELAPRATRFAVVVPSNSRGTSFERVMQASMQGAASALGVATQTFYYAQPEDVPAVLNEVVKGGCNAFWYSGDPVLRARNAEIVAFLRANRLASIGSIPGFAESGGLAHYAPDFSAFVDRTASYVDRILKGARPSDMPVEEPTKYELVINVKTAKAIGLAIPQSILARADRIIE